MEVEAFSEESCGLPSQSGKIVKTKVMTTLLPSKIIKAIEGSYEGHLRIKWLRCIRGPVPAMGPPRLPTSLGPLNSILPRLLHGDDRYG